MFLFIYFSPVIGINGQDQHQFEIANKLVLELVSPVWRSVDAWSGILAWNTFYDTMDPHSLDWLSNNFELGEKWSRSARLSLNNLSLETINMTPFWKPVKVPPIRRLNQIRPLVKDSFAKYIEDPGYNFAERKVKFKPDQAEKIYNFVNSRTNLSPAF